MCDSASCFPRTINIDQNDCSYNFYIRCGVHFGDVLGGALRRENNCYGILQRSENV